MGSQTLELKWANHKSNMTSELQELYLNDALLDVTIACGEFTLKAHKTVLSASSTFFRKLFINNPCKHPILIMTDVEFGDLKSIVEFMYQGEVHISRDKLTQFLKTADRLKVKGLTSIEDMNLNTPEHFEVDVDPQYSCGAWEDTSVRPQPQGFGSSTQVEDTLSQRKMTECVQKDTNQEMVKSVQSDTNVKLEHGTPQSANDDCMYWQSECFDQTSSSVLPDGSLPSTSTVSHQPSSSSSHQVPLSHQLSASVPHQLSPSSMSHQLSTSIPSEHRVPLDNEGFTFSENQTDSGIIPQVQAESTGREIIPVSIYQSQDQSPIAIPTSSKSFEAAESVNSQPSQGGNTGNKSFSIRDGANSSQGDDIGRESPVCGIHATSLRCKLCRNIFHSHDKLREHLKFHCKLKLFVCEACNRRFARKSNLEIHLKLHTGERPFVCQQCYKSFKQQNALHYHQRIHTGEKLYQCHHCCQWLRSRSGLNRHRKKHTHIGVHLQQNKDN